MGKYFLFFVNSQKVVYQVVLLLSVYGCFFLQLDVFVVYAQDPRPAIEPGQLQPPDYMKLDLKQLMHINVTSVSKKSEKLTKTAAAIFVITQEDLRRSGVTSIPEALRLVPGLQVARMDSNKWAITSRGFNSRFANKLLVLIDGRSVYTPLFSGTFWEVQDTLLENVERIEVIRGPGGALWGANAVNGVINIITKDSHKTLGSYVSAGAGTEESGFAEARYGERVNESLAYRFYLKGFTRDSGEVKHDTEHDDWRMARGGFRADFTTVYESTITVQGDYYRGVAGQRIFVPDLSLPTLIRIEDEDVLLSGGNVLFRWTKPIGSQSDFVLQMYYDRTERDEHLYQENRDTWDFDVQYRFPFLNRHEIMVGVGYRLTADNIRGSSAATVSAESRHDQLFSTFVRDEITLVPDRLILALGSKFEHNDYTDFEIQPSATLLFSPSTKQTIWGAVSRAVRTPSRLENTANFLAPAPEGFPVPVLEIATDGDFDSEELAAYEFGYRIQLSNRVSLDFATFYNVYDDLQTAEPVSLAIPPTFSPQNKMDGEAYGFEAAARWQPFDWCQIHSFYTLMDLQLHVDNSSRDTVREVIFEEDIPAHQFSIRFLMDLPYNLELDSWFRYVDNINSGVSGVNNYLTLDIHLGWRPLDNLEFSITGQNLLDQSQQEYIPSTLVNTQITEVERGVYGKISWYF